MEWLQNLVNMIPGGESTLAAALATVVEVVLRLVPSSVPLSILRGVASVVDVSARLLVKLDGLLDRVIPQRLDQ